MQLDELMTQFRLASRGLFNNFFRTKDPYRTNGWELEERFREVQSVLFQALVTQPANLQEVPYGQPQPGIMVRLKTEFAPIMLNRDINSGYWDYPLKEVTRDTRMIFIEFFDWDQLDVRDNRYVRVIVNSWPSRPEAQGKHALIESHYVEFIGT